MGMLVDGVWNDQTDQFMQNGVFKREASLLPTQINDDVIERLKLVPSEFVLVASASCPWSHGAVLTAVIKGFSNILPLQWAGGARIEGYGLMPLGPLSQRPLSQGQNIEHIHQLYTQTDPRFTGRATVPILWDNKHRQIISNSSADIIQLLNNARDGTGDDAGGDIDLCPPHQVKQIEKLIQDNFDGLSNAVYRAGLAERQDEYSDAVDSVFQTLENLEQRLSDRKYLFGPQLTVADIRLFATLVRFDTVYATHFRCTRKRLVDHPNLWAFTRRIYHIPGIKETVDFDEIRYGYFINDGSHNPFGIISGQPDIDWDDVADLK